MELWTGFNHVGPPAFAAGAPGGPQQGHGQAAPRPLHLRGGKRHLARLRAATEAVATLPQVEGDSVHWLLVGTFDPIHLLSAALGAFGSHCTVLRLATLSLSKKNVELLCGLVDTGAVKALRVITSSFQAKHDPEIFAHLQAELRGRGQQAGHARNHAKLALAELADGRKYVFEGSANLRSCRNVEQQALHRSAELHAFYSEWFDDALTAALAKAKAEEADDEDDQDDEDGEG